MKPIHKKLISAAIITLSFACSLIVAKPADAADCKVTSAVWSPATGGDSVAPRSLDIKTSDCGDGNWFAQVILTEIDGLTGGVVLEETGDKKLISKKIASDGSAKFTFNPGEYKCDNNSSPDCQIKTLIKTYKIVFLEGFFGGTYPEKKISDSFTNTPALSYDCRITNQCAQGTTWLLFGDNSDYVNSCTVTSAVFEKPKDSGYVGDTDGKTLYVGEKNAIIIDTKDCAGYPIYVSLVEGNGAVGDPPEKLDSGYSEGFMSNEKFTVPDSGQIRIDLVVGDRQCNQDSDRPDCLYYLVAGPTRFTDTDNLERNYFSKGKTGGRLAFECKQSNIFCDTSWTYLGDSSTPKNTTVVVNNPATNTEVECLDGDGKPIPGCYKLYDGLSEILNKTSEKTGTTFATINTSESLGGFMNALIAIAIGIAGIIAVIMIIVQGAKYMGATRGGNPVEIAETKSSILKTVLGFLLLLTMYTLLRTINPDLLNLTPSLDSVNFKTGGDPDVVTEPQAAQESQTFKQFAASHGIFCPGSGGVAQIPAIAKSMVGKITYSMENRGKTCSNNTFCLDCSGFVTQVYTCAGLPSPGYTTKSMFSGATALTSIPSTTTANGKTLVPGDLLGWVQGSIVNGEAESNGHVVLYIGNGQAIESTSGDGGKSPGKAIQIKPTNAYGRRLKFINSI